MRILIIEDQTAIAANLYDYLEAAGHEVEAAHDGQRGYALAAPGRFDAVVLDLGLPGMDGMQVLRRLREEKCDTPVLVLTARDTLGDKLAGFAYGADDYVVKPFALEEVAARLEALHKRRAGRTVSRRLEVGDLIYDPATLSVTYGGKPVKLPPKCLRLLEMLMARPGHTLRREEIEIELWGDRQDLSDRLRNHTSVLRRALVAAGGRDPIVTVHGIGLRLAPKP